MPLPLTAATPMPTALEDSLVEIAAALEPGLSRETIVSALKAGCSTRAKRRRAAQAVITDPGLLTCGRPDGPVAVDDFIHSLAAAGAAHVVLPACPSCQKPSPLSEGWEQTRICRPCKGAKRRVAHPCEVCGRRRFAHHDREGRKVCRRCRPGQDVDPVEVIAELVAPLAAGVDPVALRGAIRSVTKFPYDLLTLSWEIEDRPDLLTGQGQQGSAPLARLVVNLIAAGAPGVIAPPCPQCSKTLPLTHTRNGLRVCKPCYRRTAPTEPCSGCGRDRAPHGRTDDGGALCATCFNIHPDNLITCIRCEKIRPVGRRTSDGTLCKICYRLPIALCSICGKQRPCFQASTALPRCENCSRIPDLCVRCNRTVQVMARIPEGRLCQTCWAKEPSYFKTCASCGSVEHLRHQGLCDRCACDKLARSMLNGPDGQLRDGLEPVHQALVTTNRPAGVMIWLTRRSHAADVLRRLGTADTPISHDTLDQLAPDQSIEHLRAILVGAGVLEPRDERIIGIERWLATATSDLDPDDRKLVQAFATWNQLGRLRRRLAGRPASQEQVTAVRANIREALRLLAWLREHNRTLATCTQYDLDIWIDEGASTRLHSRTFVRWAVANKHATRIEVPTPARLNPTDPIDDDARWALVRQLLHDDTIRLEDRVAGLLVLLYAQPITALARLRVDQVHQDGDQVHLHLGDAPLELPAPFSHLAAALATNRRSWALIGRNKPSPWLFPGAHPDRHLSPVHIGTRLKRLGIYSRPTRNSALRDLSAQLPAAVIARLLRLSVSTATRWQQTGGHWTEYASEVARRQDTRTDPFLKD